VAGIGIPPDATVVRPVAGIGIPPDATVVRPVAGAGAPPDATVVRPARRGAPMPSGPEPSSGPPPASPPPRSSGLVGRITGITQRRPGRWLVAIVLFTLVASVFGAPVAGMMHANNPFNTSTSQSVQVTNLIGRATNRLPGAEVIALITPPGGFDAVGTRAEVEGVAAKMRRDPAVAGTQTFYDTHSSAFVSRDRRLTYVAVYLKNLKDAQTDDAASRLEKAFANTPGVKLGGAAVAGQQVGTQTIKDLGIAEALAFPILFLLLLWVFRGVVAALMPLFVGTITVMTTFFGLRIVNSFLSLSVFALNIVIGLGLGLAIDYSLFVLSRYREELAKLDSDGSGPAGRQALRTALGTAGRTISYSATTVALALATLCIFPMPFMVSMGLGGAMTAIVAVTVSLIALPAMLAVLGPRINAGSPARWQLAALRTARQEQAGPWYRLSRFVMRRPLPVAVTSAVLLIALGLPAIGIKFVGVDARDLPTSLSSRQVADAFSTRFATDGSADITALVKAPPSDAARVGALVAQIRRLPGATAQGPSPQALDNGYFTFVIVPRGDALGTATINLVKRIRAIASPPVQVTGTTASFLDQKSTISSKLPLVAVILCVLTALVLFLMTGSVVLPIKALIMNVLSLVAAFGVLVVIFQDGFLAGPLGFTSLHAIDLSQPVLIFAVAFGLASDYGVFLLTRIKEARDAGFSNEQAVGIGLERTGRIVTSAALCFCVAIGAFATGSVVFIKEVGIGTAAAVIIDASIIRALLVPSLMAMLGERNWWAPGPLRRLHNRIGLSDG
jgi:RND superfamily putative drug exporter